MVVTVAPEQFSMVLFDADAIRAWAEAPLDRLGMADRRPPASRSTRPRPSRGCRASWATRSWCGPRAAPSRTPGGRASSPRSPSTPPSGRTLLRARDRLSGRFESAPADADLTSRRWRRGTPTRSGRLARLGYPVHQPRWIYNFRNRHGFTDEADDAFAQHLGPPTTCRGRTSPRLSDRAAASRLPPSEGRTAARRS